MRGSLCRIGPLAKLWDFFSWYVDGFPSMPSQTTDHGVALELPPFAPVFTSLPSTASAPPSLHGRQGHTAKGLAAHLGSSGVPSSRGAGAQ